MRRIRILTILLSVFIFLALLLIVPSARGQEFTPLEEAHPSGPAPTWKVHAPWTSSCSVMDEPETREGKRTSLEPCNNEGTAG